MGTAKILLVGTAKILLVGTARHVSGHTGCGWLGDWLDAWLAGWPGWLAGWLVGWLGGWLAGRAGWLACWEFLGISLKHERWHASKHRRIVSILCHEFPISEEFG